MNQLLSIIKSTLKAKIVPLWTKISYFTNVSFLQSKVVTVIRQKFSQLFGIRPRHKDDYYGVGRLLISRRLVQAVVIVLGVISVIYIIYQINTNKPNENGTFGKVYWYNSIPLRFTNADVSIKAADGYIAYKGRVQDGMVKGNGTLYDEDEDIVYTGSFDNSQYNGDGILYYKNGEVNYKGSFVDNLFEGTGKLYRQSGALYYDGEFLKGKKEGQGILFNAAEKQIYQGTFHQDDIVYSQFLGKTAADISKSYTGTQTIYTADSDWIVIMDEIDALYTAQSADDSIRDDIETTSIYVLTGEFNYGGEEVTSIKDVTRLLGEPSFQGNSYINMAEAVAAKYLGNTAIDSKMECTHPIREIYNIESYDMGTLVYLYVYNLDDTTYTFVADPESNGFYFYSIEK